MIKSVYILFFLLFTASGSFMQEDNGGKTYYVSPAGNDQNNGFSRQKAFRTIEKVNSLNLLPGDKVLFQSGGVWAGTTGLKPMGNGITTKPIVLSSYGKGLKPVINVVEGNDNALTIEGQSNLIVRNLEFRSANHNGVAVNGKANTKVENVRIENVSAIDCSPHLGQREFDHCGIRVGGHGKGYNLPKGTWFENIVIEGCTVDNCAVGIMISGNKFDETQPVLPADSVTKNCHIINSSVSNICGDGIVMFCAADVSIKNCVCYNACKYNADNKATAGIWTWNVRNALVSHCESYGHITPGIDRNPFDSDYESYNSLFEYNYGHDCYGAAILMCAPRGTNDMSVFRYNVFKNCGMDSTRESAFIKFYDCETKQSRYIYNNTFVGSPAYFMTSLKSEAYAYVYNNIFFHTQKISYTPVKPLQGFYTNVLHKNMHGYNLYYNIEGIPFAEGNIFQDPAFADINKTGVGYCDGLKLKPNSAAIGKGKNLGDLNIGILTMGNHDFWGNKIQQNSGLDIGAHEQ